MKVFNFTKPLTGENLSNAWAKVFIECCTTLDGILSPAMVHFDVNEEGQDWQLEHQNIRNLLEKRLSEFDIYSANQSNIETVAGTIFPESIWKRCGNDRERLFDTYDSMWPSIEKCGANKHGTYFRRLTGFGDQNTNPKVNQLKAIIEKWNCGNHTHSVLQAGIFDPSLDHRNPNIRIPRFPCLQQVAFHPHGANGKHGMTVVAFYANQLLLEKAYGNYLGLFRLGKFMAGEMGLTLKGVTCITSNLKLIGKSGKKRECRSLMELLREELDNES